MVFRLIFVSLINIVLFALALKIDPPVVLTDLSRGHTEVGQKLILECKMTFHLDYVFVQWDKPNNISGIEEKPVFDKNAISEYVTTARFVIDEANLNHSGTYRCKAVHRRRNDYITSDELWIPVYKPNEHFIAFSEESMFNVAEARLQFQIRAHPNISLLWYKDDKMIETNASRYSIYTGFDSSYKQFNFYAILQFKHINVEDFGYYILEAQNKFGKRFLELSVELSMKYKSSLQVRNLSKDKKIVTYVSKHVSNPKSGIDWSAFPCYYEFTTVKKEFEVGHQVKERGLQVISYKSFNVAKDDSVLNCVWISSNGVRDTYFYLPDGFNIFGKGVQNYKLYAGFRESIKLICVASSFDNVKGIRWYLNGQIIPNYLISRQNKQYLLNTVSVLQVAYKSEYEHENYTCEVLSRSGKIRSKNVTLVSKFMTSFSPKIWVHSSTGDYAREGENVTLKCEVAFYTEFMIRWESEAFGRFSDSTVTTTRTAVNTSMYISSGTLKIFGIKLTQAGKYFCIAYGLGQTFNNFIWLPVLGLNENVIKFDEERSSFDATNVEIHIFMRVHPNPAVRWFDKYGKEINTTNFSKFLTSTSTNKDDGYNNYKTTLTFETISAQDFGNYTAIADNTFESKSHSVSVAVVKPSMYVDVYKFNEKNMTTIIKCTSINYPELSLYWEYTECDLKRCLKFDKKINYWPTSKKKQMLIERQGLRHISYISVNYSETGIFTCRDANSDSYANKVVADFKKGFAILVEEDIGVQESNNTIEIEEGQEITLICAISAFSYKNCIFWSYEGYLRVPSSESIGIAQNYDLVFSYASKIKISKEPLEQDGNYTCNVLAKNGLLKTKTVQIKTEALSYLKFDTNMKNESVLVEVGSKYQFYCYVDAFPTPVLKWFKNNKTLLSSERIKFSNNKQTLDILKVHLEDEGTYKCEVYSGFKKMSGTKTLITNKISWLYWIYALVPMLMLSILIAAFVAFKLRKKNMLLKELKLAGLSNFKQGEIENLNPEIMLKDQAELLPYDEKWEIPRQNIEIGKQLGSGAFGVVFKAEIVNFFSDEYSKTVAVKTIHKDSSFDSIKSLASELKIMVHLGKHVNVVNLIGACTKNLIKKEFYVVVEYCGLGNLLKYLIQRSRSFVDQRDPRTDEYNWAISSNKNTCNEVKYVNIKESEVKVEFSKEPHQKYIYSKDLLIWALQIAKGMEYLGSRRVVHGDLAARNVLLTDNNVVKISDFGLAKKMYKYRDYVKKGDGPLPVKWLAVETLGKGIFSIQSDVWSFGIVLWEIFSLGETPYPSIEFNEKFYKLLVNGYRMESPTAASSKIYEMMLDCWNADPVLRPSFSSLAEEIGSLLDASVRKHYADLNKRYDQESISDTDYLGKVCFPTFEKIIKTAATLKYASIEHGYAED